MVGDVDPRVGEHLLDVLGASGIAAYLQPASDLHPVTRTTTLPARPTDRLYADRRHLDTARGYLTQLDTQLDDETGPDDGPPPGPGAGLADDARPGEEVRLDLDDEFVVPHDVGDEPATTAPTGSRVANDPTAAEIDAVFASIVAGFHTAVDPAERSWPVSEEIGADETPRRRRTDRQPPEPDSDGARLRRTRGADPDEPSLLDGLDLFGTRLTPEAEEDEGYTPPPPPPLPRISKAATTALLAIIVGLVLFFWPSLLPIEQSVALLLGFGAVLGGFITLVWRLRPGDADDDDPDDGARV